MNAASQNLTYLQHNISLNGSPDCDHVHRNESHEARPQIWPGEHMCTQFGEREPWQSKGKISALSDFAFQPDLTTMSRHEISSDKHPQPESAPTHIAFAFYLRQPVEN